MKMNSILDIRQYFVDELNSESYTIDKTGARTIELIGASFKADAPSIFGTPSEIYIAKELDWYESQSTNIFDINKGSGEDAPAAWKYAANTHGEINSNYGHLIYANKYHDQYQNVLAELDKNPDGRRASMIYNRPSIWVEFDENGKSDFICTNAVTYYIRDNLLHCVVQMRSNDVVFGYKNDYAWQRCVQNLLVEDLNNGPRTNDRVIAGTVIWQVQNLHVYERHFNLVT